MPSEFRPTEPNDGPRLVELAQRLLGVAPESPMFSERHMRWKYWLPASPDDASPRGYVLVRDGAIVAHAAALPLRYHARGRSFTLLHPFDWMSEPSAIGSGAALLQRLSKLADGLLIVGGSETTRRMVRPLGFRGFGDVHMYAAPATPRPSAPPHRVHPIAPDALAGAPPGGPSPWLSAERRAEWLRACLDCPATPMALLSAGDAARSFGELVLAFAPGQARIAAFWPASARPEERAALLRIARRHAAERSDTDEVVCMANAPHDRAALEDAGFQAVGSVPMFVLAPSSVLSDDDRLGFQMLDGDLAFLHHGEPWPWLPARSA